MTRTKKCRDMLTSMLCLLFVMLFCGSSDGHINLVDGGYENVVVQIAEDVPMHDCEALFKGLEELITKGSAVLYTATHHRIFIRRVTVVVPDSWNGGSCSSPVIIAPKPSQKPTISIGAPHPVWGNSPWTLQVGGCGKPGQRIYLTPEFLEQRNHTASYSGRLFAQEWAKFRWGVFEEYGHPEDLLYPTFYRTDVRNHEPTGCSNLPVVGIPDGLCNAYHPKCSFRADPQRNKQVTSSLMYLHDLPNVGQFCGETTHEPSAPTKHNAMCGGRSVWEVMSQHPDFFNGALSGDPHRNTQPVFTYIRPAENRYVFVVEDTNVMNTQKRWELLRKAVRRMLVYHIPPGEKVAVVIFDENARITLPLSTVPSMLKDRQRLATASLPRTPSRVVEKSKSVVKGVQSAVNILEENNESAMGGVIFLISSGGSLKDEDRNKLHHLVLNKQVKVVPIIYPLTPRSSSKSGGIDQLATMSGTRWYAVADEGIGYVSKVSMMVALMKSLYSALRLFIASPHTLPVLVHQQDFPGFASMSNPLSRGDFVLDSTLGGEMRFSVTFFDLDHVGRIELYGPQGVDVNAERKMEEEDGDVNMIFITVKNAVAGRWSYSVENKADSHQSLHIQVVATPSHSTTNSGSSLGGRYNTLTPPKPSAITLQTWTSGSVVSTASAQTDGPLVVYAQIWAGLRAVVNADVTAIVQRMGINSTGSEFKPTAFRLMDSGAGCDITGNDGVYCRYLPALSSGRYTISVVATDGGKADLISPPAQKTPLYMGGRMNSNRIGRSVAYGHEGPYCCGSQVPFTSKQDSGMFAREDIAGVLNILEDVSPYHPSKITDLKSIVNPATAQITLQWTAPGNQLDHGNASQYEMVYGRDFGKVANGTGTRFMDLKAPEMAGTPSEHLLKRWHHLDTVYFVVLRAVSKFGLPGPWSVPTRIFMPSPATTTEINTRGSTLAGPLGTNLGNWEAPRKKTLSTKYLLIIIAASCGFLIILVCLAVYYVVAVTRRRKKKEQKVKKPENIPPVEPESETDSITKQPTEDLTEAKKEPRPLSPVQSWPASRLLNEHERRCPPHGDPPPDIGIPTHPHPFLYHTMNGRYIEDNLPFDGGSLVSTQPSDSMLVYRLDTGATETSSSNVQWDPNPMSPHPMMEHLSQHQHQQHQQQQQQHPQQHQQHVSSTTLPNDRRRRNVTQV